ncbi:MAG: RNA polymerase factor sigma-54 [Akkermansiaceae bacterium]
MPSSGINQGLHQGLAQKQTLSPQMRQSLEILQSNSMELAQLISQVAETNPTLEVSEDLDQIEEVVQVEAERDTENLSELDDTWREDQILMHGSRQSTGDEEERREFLYNSIVAPKTLQQHLVEQLNRAAVDDDRYLAAEYLIGCINDRGFLEDSLEALVAVSTFTDKQLRSAQTLIQGFDPAGIAVENLTESLLLQLQLIGKGSSLESRIVDQHLDDLARHRYANITRALGVSQEAVIEAADNIAQLNPDPGAAFDASSNPHVTADIELKTDRDGKYYAHLTGDHLPKVRISNHYKDLLAKINTDPKTRKYLRDNIHEGRQILNAISLRQETLLKIGTEIINRQPDFLVHGISKLRPMTMHDVAENIGVHAATISRAVSAKYILTPHGLIDLRSFFSSGYTTNQGTEISNSGVRDSIQQLVAHEDVSKPLSDTAIEKKLKAQGVSVARRTIAKYRDQLNILPSHLRKRHI